MGFVGELTAALAVLCIAFWWYKKVYDVRKKLSWLKKRPGLPILGNALEFTKGSTGAAVAVITILYFLFDNIIRVNSERRKLRWLKRRPGRFLLGCALEFKGGSQEHLNTLSRMVKDSGEAKCAYIEFMYRSILIITDYKLLEFVLGSNSLKLLDKSDDYLHLHRWLGTGLLTSSGPKWKKRRRILTPAFHFQILEQFIDVFESNGKIMIEKLNGVVGKNSVDVYPFISLCALDIICETAMGVSINAQHNEDSDYVVSVKEMCRIIVDRAFSPIEMFDFLYQFCQNWKIEKKALKVLHTKTESVIEQRRREMEGRQKTAEETDDLGIKRRKAFLDLLLESTIDGKPLTNADVREEVDTFMFEGHDTTATAMSFALYELANHPEVQAKILEEQKAIFQEERPVTYRDLQEMKYLDNVVKEVLRLYPSVPFFARNVTEDVEFESNYYTKGKIIPKDTTIAILTFAINRDENFFENPDKFDPDRFDNIDGTSPYSYIPFSAGPRNCIGQKFAMLEMKSTIAKVINNFELFPSIPEHKLILASETVLKSANGVRIRFNKRTKV